MRYIFHSMFGSMSGWGKTCKQCSIHSSWLLFPLYPQISFFTETAGLLLQLHGGVPQIWTEKAIGSSEKGLWDALHSFHWQKRPDASLTPTPRSPRMWMNFTEYEANLHRHPCSYRTLRREECVGDVKQQQQQGQLHARVPLFHSFANHEAALPQEGGLKGWVVDKKMACQGVTAGPCSASVSVSEGPSTHTAINTYSTNRRQGRL